jgi:AbrB family looped-hinge helix DNA binding protein
MAETTRLTEKGQATIPKGFREKYGLNPGDELVWQEGEDGIFVRKKRESARGALVPENTSDEQREAVAQALEHRIQEIREQNQPPVEDDI